MHSEKLLLLFHDEYGYLSCHCQYQKGLSITTPKHAGL